MNRARTLVLVLWCYAVALPAYVLIDRGGIIRALLLAAPLPILGGLAQRTGSRLDRALRDARSSGAGFRAAFGSAISGMAMIGPDKRFLRVNDALCEMLGYTEEELVGRPYMEFTHPDDPEDSEQFDGLVGLELSLYQVERRYVRKDGGVVWVQLGARALHDEQGNLKYFITQTNDITDRKRVEAQMEHAALHDPLTLLPNRVLFVDRLRGALLRLRRRPGSLAVLFVDLDRFKLVNDTIGHEAGDAVLRESAVRLGQAVREADTVARFGGDEFTIVCEGADEPEALWVAERVLRALAQPFVHDGREFQLSASVGVRIAEDPELDADGLLRDADAAMYAAKQQGRARLAVFGREARPRTFDPLATETDLRHAIESGQLRLHYQPEVALSTGRAIAVEALVRWEHPTRGLVPPGEFISVAEESGLIVALGEWVIREACRQLAEWREAGLVDPALRMALNVSARQLSEPGLVALFERTLKANGLEPEALVVEITESGLFNDEPVALASLQAMKRLGLKLALDDFGVGFSSLSRIRDLPALDVIKIDRSFVSGFRTRPADVAVVSAVLSLADRLGVIAVAEGIESREQLEALQGLGCDVGQGFLLARPQPAQAIVELLHPAASDVFVQRA